MSLSGYNAQNSIVVVIVYLFDSICSVFCFVVIYDIIIKISGYSERGENNMDKSKKEQGKKCFIITPIGDSASDTFRMAKGVIESVIKPVLTQNGYDDIKPSYEINQTGMINTQIISRIMDDDLVIANLTGNNPNVMYELCLRHVTAKPIIHICQSGTVLPFDIKDNRTIFYKDDMLGAHELMSQLESFVKEIDYEKEYVDNPIYNAQRMGKLLKEVPADSKNKVEIELLQNILEQISTLKITSNRDDTTPNANNNRNSKMYLIEILQSDVKADINVFWQELCTYIKAHDYSIVLDEQGKILCISGGKLSENFLRQFVFSISKKYGVTTRMNIIG